MYSFKLGFASSQLYFNTRFQLRLATPVQKFLTNSTVKTLVQVYSYSYNITNKFLHLLQNVDNYESKLLVGN